MNIADFLSALDGCGLVITDEGLIRDTLEEWGMKIGNELIINKDECDEDASLEVW